jgi:hypothetical protein
MPNKEITTKSIGNLIKENREKEGAAKSKT